MPDAVAVPELEPLFAWVRAAGGALDAVRVGVTEGGRGVFAARDLVAGEVVLRVPSACFLTPADGARTALGQQIERGWDLPAKEPALLAALLVTGGEEPWRAALPATLPAFPCFYGPEDAALLAGTSAAVFLDARRARLAEEAWWLTGRGLAAAGWALARALVTARQFGTAAGPALVPVADLLDHAAVPEVAWDVDAAGLVFHALMDVPAGAPLRHDYGAKSNARLLVNYGFTLEENPLCDCVIELDGEVFLRAGSAPVQAALATAAGRERLLAACVAKLAALPAPGVDTENRRNIARVAADERRWVQAWMAAALGCPDPADRAMASSATCVSPSDPPRRPA